MNGSTRDHDRERILRLSSGDGYVVSDSAAASIRASTTAWVEIEDLEESMTVAIRPEHVVAIEPLPDDYESDERYDEEDEDEEEDEE